MKAHALLLMVFLLSCSSSPQKPKQETRRITVLAQLPKSLGLPDAIEAYQLVSLQSPKGTQKLQVVLKHNDKTLRFVALGALGQILFEGSYQEGRLFIENNQIPRMTRLAQYAMADLILVYSNPKELIPLLSQKIDLRVGPKTRVFSMNQEPIVEVIYENQNPWQGTVRLVNIPGRYTLTVTTLRFKKL